MLIELKLDTDFERHLEFLKNKYGSDFEYLNGLHPSQLDYSEFLAKFVGNRTMADSTIDPNANANHKDIRSFMTEKGKSEDKLFALSKIFVEIKKKWGIRTAKAWLEQEFSKGFYLNDAWSASYFPYCYKGDNLATYKYNGNVFCCSFSELYDILPQECERYDENILQVAKFPEDLFVLDIVDDEETFVKVLRVVKHHNELPMRVLKTANGITQIVTSNHPVITDSGDIPASEVTEEDFVLTISPNVFDESVSEIQNFKLSKDIGWLVGMSLSEGWVSGDSVFIGQDINTDTGKKLVHCLTSLGTEYSVYEGRKIYIKSGNVKSLLKYFLGDLKADSKKLPNDFIHFPKEFLCGFIAGIVDGDGTIMDKRNASIRVTSGVLVHQIAMILNGLGIMGRERMPYTGCGVGVSHKTVYGISFRIPNKEMFEESVKIQSRFVESTRNLTKYSSLNHKYSSDFGFNSIIDNVEFIEECDEVYDITTESGHFICNNILSHNCWANDLSRLAKEGLFFLNPQGLKNYLEEGEDISRDSHGKIQYYEVKQYNNQPPKHLSTYFDDVIEFVSFLSNRQSGAVGLPNVIIWAYYFWKKDVESGYCNKDAQTYLRQNFQKFIYRLNQPFLRIDQCAFTNVSIFDRPYLESLFGGMEFPDGSFAIDEMDEIMECQKAFMEVVSDIRTENMFTFPVLTYSLYYKDGKFQDEEFAMWASSHNIKWSDSNFFVSDNIGILSNCCRLLSDTQKLDAFINSIGGTSLSVGSCRVSTINLARIAYESKFKKGKYIDILKERVLLDCKALTSMRHILKRNIEKGLLPNYQDGALELEKQFCTIGIIGMYEVMDLFGLINTDEFGNKSYSDEAVEFTSQILSTINEVKDSFECDFTFNVEAIPAENCAGVICQADNLLFEQDKYFIYSNQWIPLMEKCTIQEKCRLGSIFDKQCGGGCIAHINIENRFTNKEEAWDMLNYVASQGVIYFAFNTKISVCSDKHAFIGTETCPRCGKLVMDKYSRVVGFYTPVSSYQKIRKQEFDKRKWYNVVSKDSIG